MFSDNAYQPALINLLYKGTAVSSRVVQNVSALMKARFRVSAPIIRTFLQP